MSNNGKLSRVLVIEDDPDVRTVISVSLQKVGGLTVKLCSSGAEALNEAPIFSPDMILMDVMMDVMDGPTTLKALKKDPRLSGVPVVFLTAKQQPLEVKRFMELDVLDVIGKPFDPMKLPNIIKEIWSAYVFGKEINKNLDSLRAGFKDRLPARIKEIESILNSLLDGSDDEEDWKSGILKLHNLEGTCFTYEFNEAGESCRLLGALIKEASKKRRLTDGQIYRLGELLNHLKEGSISKEGRKLRTPSPAYREPFTEGTDRLLFLVDDDTDITEWMIMQLRPFGYQVRAFSRLAEFREALRDTTPSAIIMDVVFGEDDRAGTELITELRQILRGSVPVIFLSARTDFMSRLSAVRSRARTYLTKPVDLNILISNLDALLSIQEPAAEPHRVLIIEDDPDQAAFIAEILERAGILTKKVTDASDILDFLADFNPDLILMDLYMSECSGFELAILIRQHDSYVSMPIVFLSRETTMEKHLTALRLGGDDFLTKPISPDHLISSVTARIARARTMKSFMVRDSLTGLYNHSSINEHLDRSLSVAIRNNKPLAVAMIDIDHFKSINDSYGHPTGDRVLKSLSILFRQRLRIGDIVGRYGGEEFVVILPDTDLKTAVSVLEEVRDSFSKIMHRDKETDFSATFSCGISAYPQSYCDPKRLLDAADKALYEAKNSGKNRISSAG